MLRRALLTFFTLLSLLVGASFFGEKVLAQDEPNWNQCGGNQQCTPTACGLAAPYWSGGLLTPGTCSFYCRGGGTYDPPRCSNGESHSISCPPGTPYEQQNICFPGNGTEGCINGAWCKVNCGVRNPSCAHNYTTETWCSGGCSPSPTPTPTPTPGGGTPTPGGGTPPDAPSPTPTFSGSVYLDPQALPLGIGGTDNLCTGNTSSGALTSVTGSSVSVNRAGESTSTSVTGATYSVATESVSGDYTIALTLPFPPADPDNPLQCACNSDLSDPYRCVYTNQAPSGNVNFFVKQGIASTAWFQTLGGSSWAAGSIESKIPFSTCSAPGCIAALITRDPLGTIDSAGFPLTQTGSVVTSDSGGVYIHEADGRSTALQAGALGVSVPKENYQSFFAKFGGRATALPNALKPIASEGLQIYRYNGNMVINNTNPWQVGSNEQVIVFVNGNLTIDDTPAGQNRLTTVESGGSGFLMFLVRNAITITANVGYTSKTTDPTTPNIANVEGVFVADETLTVAGYSGVADRKFIGAGTFVGWGGVVLERNYDGGSSPGANNTAPTEVFLFRPDLLLNAPREIKSAQMTWREIVPSFGF